MNQVQVLRICVVGSTPTVRFAGEELTRYVTQMMGIAPLEVETRSDAQIVVGLEADLFGAKPLEESGWMQTDAFTIRTIDRVLHLSGVNPRSVLYAVYAWLETQGCAWLYPGPEGELIPSLPSPALEGFDIHETASNPIRGMACFPKSEVAGPQMIDWMAKRRCNYYFQEAFGIDRPGGEFGEPVSEDERVGLCAWKQQMLDAARCRGMMIERFGHGWTRGLVKRLATEWNVTPAEAYSRITSKGANRLAEENAYDDAGQEFCLSHPDVQRVLAAQISEFLEAHADEQDIAAIWMGDGWNMACQCERCRSRSFTDWYLEIIRAIATRLKDSSPDLKIEVLVYMATLDPPTSRLLDGFDNIILLLGPMQRCYTHPLFDDTCRHEGWAPDYANNAATDNVNFRGPLNGDYMDAVQGWREKVDAPWYIFDYFNWFSVNIGQQFLSYRADTLAEETAQTASHGFAGMVPCNYARVAFPTNLPAETVARILWDRSLTAEAIRMEYLTAAFELLAPAVLRHSDAMAEILHLRDPHKDPFWQEDGAVYVKMVARLEEEARMFEASLAGEEMSPRVQRRIEYLHVNLSFLLQTYRILNLHRNGKADEALVLQEALVAYEEEQHNLIDELGCAWQWRVFAKGLKERLQNPDKWR